LEVISGDKPIKFFLISTSPNLRPSLHQYLLQSILIKTQANRPNQGLIKTQANKSAVPAGMYSCRT